METEDLRTRMRRAAAWLDASPSEVAGLGVLLVGALAVAVVLWWTGRPVPVSDAPVAPTGTAPDAAAPDQVTVHVAGAVVRPGLVTVPTGARVADAIAAAGGATVDADLDPLNLARALTDGERVAVPRIGDATVAAPGGSASPSRGVRPDGRVDLNLATASELESLPGIGPALAQRILAWREDNGGFREVGQLREVSGIGEKTFQQLADLVAV